MDSVVAQRGEKTKGSFHDSLQVNETGAWTKCLDIWWTCGPKKNIYSIMEIYIHEEFWEAWEAAEDFAVI